ncbi:MAG: DNA-processing protein DprA [Patescibacteria group bacterium]
MRYHAVLAHFTKITYGRYKKLAAHFSDLKNLWEAGLAELVKAGLEENIAREFLLWRSQNPAEQILERLEKENIRTVSITEPDYPALLKEIYDPPHTLFVRGILPKNGPALAVVGTRKLTGYGRQACEELVKPLAKSGLIIVSGLALGIDGVAHQTALDNNGITLAVLGSGIDKQHIYPAAHKQLAEKIISQGGAVISEYPPGFLPSQYSFPARNRIIAGLCLGTLVIEAPESSGALITARHALDYNREVFAVPHPINSLTGAGPNNLIKLGARLITAAQDIADALNLKIMADTAIDGHDASLSADENKILAVLSGEPKHIDNIIKETNLPSQTITANLTLLEVKSKVRNLGGMNYVKTL